MKLIVKQRVLPIGEMDFFETTENFELDKEYNCFELACGEIIACQVKSGKKVEVSFVNILDNENNFELYNTKEVVLDKKVEMFDMNRYLKDESLVVYIKK